MADEKLLMTEKTETRTTHTTASQEQRPSLLSSALAIVGFIILIVIVLWGFFRFATLASPWLSSLFKTSAAIQVTAPANATSGEAFTVSWKYSTSEKGMYALLYQCKNNVRLETVNAAGSSNVIPCGAAYVIPSAENKVAVTPILSGTATTSIPLSLIFIPSATTSTSSGQASSKQAQGSATVLIHPAPVAPVAVVTPPESATPRVTSPADLSVRIISTTVDPSGMAVVEFDIANNGGNSSGVYYFEAYLPTQSVYTYSSPAQSPLGPGDHVVNTLRFTQTVQGAVSIVADPAHAVQESNEDNNYASQYLSAPYYAPQPYQYPYVY